MKRNLLIAAGLIGSVVAGTLLYRRNRNKTAEVMHDAADAAGEAHGNIRKYLRKTDRKLEENLNPALP